MRGDRQFKETKDMLSIVRAMNEHKRVRTSRRFMLTEDEKKKDAIAITNEPKFGQNVLQGQIDAFKQSVNAGAKFAKENSEDVENNPLVYYPKTGNLVFSGSIPQLNNLRFQFSMNDITSSPYIFVDGLALSEETITTLAKLRGFYLNWCDEWRASGDLLDKL